MGGHVDAARLLLDKGADVDQSRNGVTLLFLACQNGHVDVAQLLLERSAEVDRAQENGTTRRRCPSQNYGATRPSSRCSRSPDHYHSESRASYGSSRTSSALSASGRASNARGRSAITASAASASRKCVGRTHRRIEPRVRFAGSPCFWANSRDDQAWQAAP